MTSTSPPMRTSGRRSPTGSGPTTPTTSPACTRSPPATRWWTPSRLRCGLVTPASSSSPAVRTSLERGRSARRRTRPTTSRRARRKVRPLISRLAADTLEDAVVELRSLPAPEAAGERFDRGYTVLGHLVDSLRQLAADPAATTAANAPASSADQDLTNLLNQVAHLQIGLERCAINPLR